MVHGEESSRRTTLSERFPPGWPLVINPAFQLPGPRLARTLPSSETCLIKSPCLAGNPTLYPRRLLSSLPFPPSQPYISRSLGSSIQTLIPEPQQSSACSIRHFGPLGDGVRCELGSVRGSQIPAVLLIVHIIFITHILFFPKTNLPS